MRTAAVLGVALLLLAPPELAGAQSDGSLTVAFQGVDRREGVVLVALFDSRETYDANSGAVRTLTLPAADGNFSVTLAGLPPGHYAVKAFHDRDGDGKMKFNPLGMPLEPYGFSNNARAPFGPPSWRRASFTIAAGATSQSIRLR